MLHLLQRICWNRQGWQRPSGDAVESGYPSDEGFGFEEWNFNKEQACDGEVYGYLPYWPSDRNRRIAQGRYHIDFFTIEPYTKLRLMVGRYRDAREAGPDDAAKVDAHFRANGIYEIRAEELREALAASGRRMTAQAALRRVRAIVLDPDFRFICPVEDIEVFPSPVEFKLPDERGINPRFSKPTILKRPVRVDRPGNGPKNKSLENFSPRPGPLAENAYPRATAAELRTIIPLHNKLSNRFAEWLKENGRQSVYQERGRVDLEYREESLLCRAELKVCYRVNTRHAIREALGQLLDYNLWGERVTADRWLIILNNKPTAEDVAFLGRLSSKHRMPLGIGWPNGRGFELRSLP